MATLIPFPYRTVAEISVKNLIKNLFILRSRTQKEVLPVVKADAYGHGMVAITKHLITRGFVENFCVATLDEAVELRKKVRSDFNIIVLSGFVPHQLEAYLKYQLTPVINSLTHLKSLQGREALPPLHLKIDTGLHRLGILPQEMSEAVHVLEKSQLKLAGVMTHFAESEKKNSTFTDQQIKLFEYWLHHLREKKRVLTDALIHVGNSGAVFSGKYSLSNAIRPGLSLYGLSPNPLFTEDSFLPVLTWKSRVLTIKTIHRGDTVGYGRTYKAKKKEKIAVVPIGYADGFCRSLSNKGHVVISGKKAAVRGRVSMDLISVDVSHISGVKEGTQVTIIGKEAKQAISAWDHALCAETIAYEFLCGISQRVPRIYID